MPPNRIPDWIPGKMTIDSSQSNWKGIELKGYIYDRQKAAIPTMRDYMIVAYTGAPTVMRRSVGGPWEEAHVGPGKISLLTRAEQSTWAWEDPIDVRHIYLSHEALELAAQSVFESDPSSIEVDDQLSSIDDNTLACFKALEAELDNGGIGQRLLIDSLRSQLAVQILRKYARVSLKVQHGSALTPETRNKVVNMINDRMGESISLDDLSDAAGMSPFHFLRQFKLAFGMAPHAFVIHQRVIKAKAMLQQGKLMHKFIALECGFSDQSHFCRTFRRVVGVTPTQFQEGA